MPTREAAAHWLKRWDRQQESSIADREERFQVVADVVTMVSGRPNPLVVDLGCGPGSLSARLLDRLPAARVVAVDADPFLLGLGRAAYGGHPGLRFVDHDLRDPGWVEALGLDRPADAVVSTTALHWLTRDELARVYAACGDLLGPAGILVDGDHLVAGPKMPRRSALEDAVARQHAERAGPAQGEDRTEDWEGWWAAARAAPELTDLTEGLDVRPVSHSVPDLPSLSDHVSLLRAAGFTEVGPVWQQGDDRVLVALR